MNSHLLLTECVLPITAGICTSQVLIQKAHIAFCSQIAILPEHHKLFTT
jgi:hypothetical protein